MKGTNVLKMNKNTMIEALNQYFERQFLASVRVTEVKPSSDTHSNGFDVTYQEVTESEEDG